MHTDLKTIIYTLHLLYLDTFYTILTGRLFQLWIMVTFCVQTNNLENDRKVLRSLFCFLLKNQQSTIKWVELRGICMTSTLGHTSNGYLYRITSWKLEPLGKSRKEEVFDTTDSVGCHCYLKDGTQGRNSDT